MTKNNPLANRSFQAFNMLTGNTSPEGHILQLSISKLHEFANHPFHVKDDESMDELVDSIKENGVLEPILVRKTSNEVYEIIAGHRRVHACTRLGLPTIPAIVRAYDNDEATIIMVDSNIQRDHLDYSEKAYAFKMKYDAMKHQGSKGEAATADMIGAEANESGRQILRYIRLTNLSPALLEMVDHKIIGFTTAVDLSFLSRPEQDYLEKQIIETGTIPSGKQAKQLKECSLKQELTEDSFSDILTTIPKIKTKSFAASSEIASFFPDGTSSKEMEDIIIQLLNAWKK